VNQSLGPLNRSNSSLGSCSTSKASASSSATRGEYKMPPIRKSFHESPLNCCETILHLYWVPGVSCFISRLSTYRETDFLTALESLAADLIAATQRTARPAQNVIEPRTGECELSSGQSSMNSFLKLGVTKRVRRRDPKNIRTVWMRLCRPLALLPCPVRRTAALNGTVANRWPK